MSHRTRFLVVLMVLLPGAFLACRIPATLPVGLAAATATGSPPVPSAPSAGTAAADAAIPASIATFAVSPTATARPATATPTVVPTPFEVSYLETGPLAFIHAPTGAVLQPHVIISAVELTPSGTRLEVHGTRNLDEFICTNFPCVLPLEESSTIIFQAMNGAGDVGRQVQARVRVDRLDGNYMVTLESLSQFARFTDTCALDWDISDDTNPRWAQFYQSPSQLNTDKTLHHLTTQLIANGIVDASDCPGGGLSSDLGWPNGCGLERARPAMVQWQNQYDVQIWLASLQTGIPPRILKTLIEVESQFWPGNERFYLDEIGLGQVNHLGVDILLRQNDAMYQQVCSEVLPACFTPYRFLLPAEQAMIRGALVNSFNAGCATCPYGLDLAKSQQSIGLIGQMLKSNCLQMVGLDIDEDEPTTYEDYWRFTLVSYHSGYSCILNAVRAARKADEPLTWAGVRDYIDCRGGAEYGDGLFANLLAFDTYLLEAEPAALAQPGGLAPGQFGATLVPPPTPLPAPTLIPSTATIHVLVYEDANGNGTAETAELLNGVRVSVVLANGIQFSGITLGGEVSFDMRSYPAGIRTTVSLPGLYRDQAFDLPASGVVEVVFAFEGPALPTRLP